MVKDPFEVQPKLFILPGKEINNVLNAKGRQPLDLNDDQAYAIQKDSIKPLEYL